MVVIVFFYFYVNIRFILFNVISKWRISDFILSDTEEKAIEREMNVYIYKYDNISLFRS